MAATPSTIEHFKGESSHGPVTLFIDDRGEMVLVCERDGQAWKLPTNAEVIKESADRRENDDDEGLLLAKEEGDRSFMAMRDDHLALARRLFSTP